MANNGRIVDTLFVGCTRPTTFWGVPLTAFIPELIVVMEGFIFSHNLLYLLLFFPAHGVAYLICLKEPRFFEMIWLWFMTKGPALLGNFRYWKSSSYSPLPIFTGKSLKKLVKDYNQ